jgi:hypothetical protein
MVEISIQEIATPSENMRKEGFKASPSTAGASLVLESG